MGFEAWLEAIGRRGREGDWVLAGEHPTAPPHRAMRLVPDGHQVVGFDRGRLRAYPLRRFLMRSERVVLARPAAPAPLGAESGRDPVSTWLTAQTVFDSAPARRCSDPTRFGSYLRGTTGVRHAVRVSPVLVRGSVPDTRGVAWLAELGIRTIVDLRNHPSGEVRSSAKSCGLRYEAIPINPHREPAPSQIEHFLEAVSAIDLQPVYVHCKHGVDRTGAMMAIWRIDFDGWSPALALEEMDYLGARLDRPALRAAVQHHVGSARLRRDDISTSMSSRLHPHDG